MYGLNEYARSFRNGLNYVLYDSSNTDRVEPVLEESSIESIGYYDGYNYGEYLEMTGQTMSVSSEQIIAEIDKHHTRALDRYGKTLGFVDNNKDQVK